MPRHAAATARLLSARLLALVAVAVAAAAAAALASPAPAWCAADAAPRPFELRADPAALQRLHARLRTWTAPPLLDDPVAARSQPWALGASLAFMHELVEYWRSPLFNWRAVEAALRRAAPQFTLDVWHERRRASSMRPDELLPRRRLVRVHFVHVRSGNATAVPLLFTHGWPSSFAECLKLVPLLGGEFDLVCPSLPGFGLSQIVAGDERQAVVPGMSPSEIGEVWDALMQCLGYGRGYVAVGGDWGAFVHATLCADNPRCLALYTSMAVAGPPFRRGISGALSTLLTLLAPSWVMDAHDLERLPETFHFASHGMGYLIQQATMPQTLAYAMHDSPVGAAAWIIEKWAAWSDCHGDPLSVFTRDELLTPVMLYYFTDSFANATQIYHEFLHRDADYMFKPPFVRAPTCVARFAGEPYTTPRHWLPYHFNVVRVTDHAHGGHFPAMEQPRALLDDVRGCVHDAGVAAVLHDEL